jgi:hypothetical protein
MAPRVRSICEKYGQHYNTGSFVKQYGEVPKRIFRYALPEGWFKVAQPRLPHFPTLWVAVNKVFRKLASLRARIG